MPYETLHGCNHNQILIESDRTVLHTVPLYHVRMVVSVQSCRHRLHTITSFADNYLNRKGSIVSMADIDTVVTRQHQRIAYTTKLQIVISFPNLLLLFPCFVPFSFATGCDNQIVNGDRYPFFLFSNMKLLMRMLIASHEIQNMRVPLFTIAPFIKSCVVIVLYSR